jgi:hypothetical protein
VLFPRHSKLAISTKRKRLGVKLDNDYISKTGKYNRSLVNEDNLCKLDQSLTLNDLSNEEYQILIGCILGDGSIKKNGSGGKSRDKWKMRNFIFYCSHNDPQLDYNDWKTIKLSVFLPKIRIGKSKEKRKSEFWTVSHPIFTQLRDKFYATRHRCNKSLIPLDLIEKMDYLGLMIWYLDDGYIGVRKDGFNTKGHHRRPSPKITAKGWELEGLKRAAEILNKNLGLHLYVKTTKHTGNSRNKLLCIPAEDRDVLFPIWQDCAKKNSLPECMNYKFDLHEWKI